MSTQHNVTSHNSKSLNELVQHFLVVCVILLDRATEIELVGHRKCMKEIFRWIKSGLRVFED